MNIKDINVSLITAATLIVFLIGAAFTIDVRYAHAEDMAKFQYQQAIKNDKLWIVILEQKLKDAKTTEDRETIKRQIEITTKSLYINMEKSQ